MIQIHIWFQQSAAEVFACCSVLFCLARSPFLGSVLFRNMDTEYFHTPFFCGSLTSPPALWEEQRAVPGTLCQGLKHGQPETSRRPRCEENGRGRETLCDTEGGGRRWRGGGEGEAASDGCRAASKCQCPKIVASNNQTEDTKQTTALRSSKHRLTQETRQTVKPPSVFRSR